MDSPLLAARAPFDLIIANILAGPLIELAPDFANALGAGRHDRPCRPARHAGRRGRARILARGTVSARGTVPHRRMAGPRLRKPGLTLVSRGGRCNSSVMKLPLLLATAALIASAASSAPISHHPKVQTKHPPKTEASAKKADDQPAKEFFKPGEVRSTGTVTVGGQPIAYDAVAGTLVVHAKDWEDTDAVEAEAGAPPTRTRQPGPSPKPRCSTRLISSRARPRLLGRSPSCSTAARAPRPYGCGWGRSGRCGC